MMVAIEYRSHCFRITGSLPLIRASQYSTLPSMDCASLASKEPSESTGESLGKMHQANQQAMQWALMYLLIHMVRIYPVQSLVLSMVLFPQPIAQPIESYYAIA